MNSHPLTIENCLQKNTHTHIQIPMNELTCGTTIVAVVFAVAKSEEIALRAIMANNT